MLFTSPLLLVFGLYHLITWFNLFGSGEWTYWKRVGFASTLAHLVLVTGFFIFIYLDFQANENFLPAGMTFSTYMLTQSQFQKLIPIFDTAAMALLLLLFTGLQAAGAGGTYLLPVTLLVVYVVGSLQWYLVGGAVGALVGRFWESLKTGDTDEEWF